MDKKIQFTVEWLKALATNAGANGLLVGVSGGVDSALTAFLIKKAFPDHSLGVILPCDSHPQDREDALSVVKAANLKHVEIDLTPTFQTLSQTVQCQLENLGEWNKEQERLSLANLKARLRMSTLYLLAQNYNYLVVGTDNAAEWHLGYFTKYGDGGVDCVPLANLTKGEVRRWAAHVGVPERVINKAPSAGLWSGQTDEEEMGTTYDMVDRYLEGKDIPEKDRLIIERLHRRSEHKRHMPPKPPVFR
ncbi:NAD(+) synthase [Caldalkalibacillus uzonensis]|nr:NAD(+) synthase [Caldalkalibacillus uzonensis]